MLLYFLSYADDYDDSYRDVRGKNYKTLIETCFRYSRYFSLSYPQSLAGYAPEKINGIAELEPYIHFKYSSQTAFYYYSDEPTMICIYNCCKESKQILLNYVDSLFSWRIYQRNPEDLAFFRQDGSVLMSQLSHEDECVLIPQINENMNAILQTGAWKKSQTNNWLYSIWTTLKIAPDTPIPADQLEHIRRWR